MKLDLKVYLSMIMFQLVLMILLGGIEEELLQMDIYNQQLNL